jgi:hypothetical protein
MNLTELRPEDVKSIEHDQEIIAIVHCPKAVDLDRKIVIVFEDSKFTTTTIDGRYMVTRDPMIVLKPKEAKFLKPLDVILSKANNYTINSSGTIRSDSWRNSITSGMFQYFGKEFNGKDAVFSHGKQQGSFCYDHSWIETKEIN